MAWEVKYYNNSVAEEIYNLPDRTVAKYQQIVERLSRFGPSEQRLPHFRHLTGKLWEIRAIAHDGSARIFYCLADQNCFIILHSFLKKSNATPKKELEKALKRLKEVQND
ncbi:type II toxin-antitoxin system RelE/ParE family toxin [Victivallis sp. Marseille-Q1083]|uniref:type II toxin-antitoxin system RelE/ParE family toxin n=1 Tax=Victivallis sp. Marseille-Q1083 TaxID=2717288 RepID=UPI00158F2A80|nr:type II toxin-antitoxin system RelE/ParE family toxin [Victivallis sp. Marseille-Q1083]